MRKPPRLATLVLGLVLVIAAIWRLFTWASAPPALPSLLTSSAATVSASAAPPAPRRSEPVRPSPSPRLALLSGSAAADAAAALGLFEGRVVSATTGRGLPGARLLLAHAGATNEITCKPDGTFRFAPPEAGTYALAHAAADGHLPFVPEWGQSPIAWTARPGARVSGFVLALDPATPFEIDVQSPDGKPVAGADVRVLGPSDGAPTDELVTDAQGQVRATLARDALVEARHADFAPARARISLNAEASHHLTLTGRVVDAAGAPVAGARVVAAFAADNPASATAALHPGGAEVTAPDGTFRLEGLDDGTYDVAASDDHHAPARAQGVPTGAEKITLILGAGGVIRGSVSSVATGRPIAAFSVVVSIARGPIERERVAARSFLDAEGRYEIGGLGPGDYDVVAVALGMAPSPLLVVTIAEPPGEPASSDLALASGATLRGTALDADTRKPLAGARVALEGALGAGSAQVPLLATATSGADGTFELRGLAMGMRSLTLTAAGHHGRIVSGITVGSVDPPPLTVELTPTKPGEEPALELVGIGAVLAAKDDAVVVGETIAGGGAAEAGLAPGDAIVAIDGTRVTELGFEAAVQKIRGPENSLVTLSVRKAGTAEAIDVVVRRRRIKA